MMGKRAAQDLARNQRLTWGDLYSLVSAPCDRSAICPVTGKRPSAEVPRDPRAMKPSRHFLTVQNILRIFGPPVWERIDDDTPEYGVDTERALAGEIEPNDAPADLVALRKA